MGRLARLALVVVAAALAAAPAAAAGPAPRVKIGHVFLLILENQAYADTFGAASQGPYLRRTLPAEGGLLTQYYAIGHASLDNYIALVSGQAPNRQTQLDCPLYGDFRLSEPALDAHGQALGTGCIYPSVVRSLPDQLEAAHLTWKGYMEDMGADPSREDATCGHARVGSRDPLLMATPGDQYASKHNPFIYFHAIIDDAARCARHVVNLKVLEQDLKQVANTPNYAFITPNLCNDGHDPQCADGSPGGPKAIDAFLKRWVPRITQSAAFRKDGLLIITFDESDGRGPEGVSACCGERPLEGADLAPGFMGPGGGRIGAVLLSPFIRPGTVSDVPYNHYSLLASVEDLFGLPRLGYAAEPDLVPFGADVFTGR